MVTKYNWSGWNSDIPGAIKDNLDDYRTDDTCPDVNETQTLPPTGGVSKLQIDLLERNKYRYNYYLPGSNEDITKPRAVPRIESVNIYHTILMQVYIRSNYV